MLLFPVISLCCSLKKHVIKLWMDCPSGKNNKHRREAAVSAQGSVYTLASDKPILRGRRQLDLRHGGNSTKV